MYSLNTYSINIKLFNKCPVLCALIPQFNILIELALVHILIGVSKIWLQTTTSIVNKLIGWFGNLWPVYIKTPMSLKKKKICWSSWNWTCNLTHQNVHTDYSAKVSIYVLEKHLDLENVSSIIDIIITKIKHQ